MRAVLKRSTNAKLRLPERMLLKKILSVVGVYFSVANYFSSDVVLVLNTLDLKQTFRINIIFEISGRKHFLL